MSGQQRQCPSTMRQLPGRRSRVHGKRHFLERGERTWTAVPSATRGSGETGPWLLCKFAEGYMCRCDEVMCCEVAEAAMRRKHDWVPRLSRLVEQQGERVTSRNEHLLPPANRYIDSCGIKPVGVLHHVKEVLNDFRSAFVCKHQTTRP